MKWNAVTVRNHKGFDRRLMLIIGISLGMILNSCKREERAFRVAPAAAQPVNAKSQTELGAAKSESELKADTKGPATRARNEYERNAYALSEGKRLFSAYNCNGCHAQGGGGMGPALMDSNWIYGGTPEQVFSTIVAGRPNGMPSFAGKVPEFQVWQLAAYVRSMSGQATKDAAPSRDDHMQGKPPEGSMEKQPIRTEGSKQ